MIEPGVRSRRQLTAVINQMAEALAAMRVKVKFSLGARTTLGPPYSCGPASKAGRTLHRAGML